MYSLASGSIRTSSVFKHYPLIDSGGQLLWQRLHTIGR